MLKALWDVIKFLFDFFNIAKSIKKYYELFFKKPSKYIHDSKEHYVFFQRAIIVLTIFFILVINLAHTRWSSPLFFNSTSVIDILKSNSLGLTLCLILFPTLLYFLTRNYLNLSFNLFICSKGSHASVHRFRNKNNEIVKFKYKQLLFRDYRNIDKDYFKQKLVLVQELYRSIGLECVNMLNQSIRDNCGLLAVKILREEVKKGELKYYVDHLSCFSTGQYKEQKRINNFPIDPNGNLNKSDSIFEYIVRLLQFKKDIDVRQEYGLSWGTSYISNNYREETNFFKFPDISWEEYYQAGITTPITIYDEVRGFLTYGTYKKNMLRSYHGQIMALHADLIAEVFRKVCPFEEDLREYTKEMEAMK